MLNLDSETEEVLTDSEDIPVPRESHSTKIPTATETPARLDLSSIKEIPSDTRQVIITSLTPETSLSKLNPITLAEAIDSIDGPVNKVEHLKSGSLLITCVTLSQVETFLDCNMFSKKNIPVKTTIAWNKHFSYGKVFAPEFKEESLTNILEYLKHLRVISVRKLYGDPTKQNIPLYVLTFLGKCPPSIKVGYSIFNIDKYYPSPLRCGTCCRWGHVSNNCRGSLTCCYCGRGGHRRADCTQTSPLCINCKQSHEASSRECSIFIRERHVCTLATDLRISFGEARSRVSGEIGDTRSVSPTISSSSNIIPPSQPPPDISSPRDFPSIEILSRSTHLSTGKSTLPQTTTAIPPSLPNSSQNSIWFSQQTRPYSNVLNDSFPPLPTLPPLSALHPPIQKNSSQNLGNSCSLNNHVAANDSPKHLTCSNNSTSFQNNNQYALDSNLDIKKLITSILTILIKLFLANSISDKMECFMQLGQIL